MSSPFTGRPRATYASRRTYARNRSVPAPAVRPRDTSQSKSADKPAADTPNDTAAAKFTDALHAPLQLSSSDRASASSLCDPMSSSSSESESDDNSSDAADVEYVLGKRSASGAPATPKRVKCAPLPASSPPPPPSRSPSPDPSPTRSPSPRAPPSRVFPFLTAALHPKPRFTSSSTSSSTLPQRSRPAQQTFLNFAAASGVNGTGNTTCDACGMAYCPLSRSDTALHARFHAQAVVGRAWTPTWGTPVWRASPSTKHRYNSEAPPDVDRIVRVSPASRAVEKRAVAELLRCVNAELAAPPENPAWRDGPAGAGAAYVYVSAAAADPDTDGAPKRRRKSAATAADTARAPAWRAVAVLVVERVTRARVLDLRTGQLLAGPTSSAARYVPAVMGVARVYTARGFRRRGLASRLLDAARRDFVYRYAVPKARVAWSQPSASGGRLALAWHGAEDDDDNGEQGHKEEDSVVLVYLESDAQAAASSSAAK